MRRVVGSTMTGVTYGAAALAILPLAVILGMLLVKGAGSIDWNFFIEVGGSRGRDRGRVRARDRRAR